ncbi:unnamed protein product [Candida verbasci]|uniref:Zn(2)-C6 fungal-type domain-containing protein n=1 Tax=Candida verbasci TaxID=1227364 RepID=A0A9W4TYB1_9ASCO|nr:unnamed protein product [Candida verbasci]
MMRRLSNRSEAAINVTENGNIVKKIQKSRQRRILSCMHCHSKKIKCSRSNPCENCIKLEIECKYFINERQSRGGKQSSRLTEDEKKMRGITLESSNDESDSSINITSSVATSLEEDENGKKSIEQPHPHPGTASIPFNLESNDLTSTTTLMQSPIVNNFTNNITNSYFSGNFTNPQPQPQPQPHPQSTTSSTPQLQNEDTISFGLSSFALANQDMIFNNMLQNHNSIERNYNSPTNNIYLFNAASTTENTNNNILEDLSKHLPPNKERSFELIERYLNSVHLLLPIIPNMKDFLIEHETFWNLESFHSPNFNHLQFFTLYFPILYAATISEFEEFDNLLLNQDIDKYLQASHKINKFYNYPHGNKSISLLLANVLIESLSPNPSTIIMSQIIRYAKFLHLHKDPLLTLRIQDWEIINFRRLLWWIIFGLDALSSHNFCLPPNCRIDDFNVLLPDESEMVNNVKKLKLSILSCNIKFRFDRILSELVYYLHNGLNSNINNDQINEIKGMILEYYNSIHVSINKMNQYYRSNLPTTVQEMNLISFVTNHCWTFVDRALMLLHKKILLNDNHEETTQIQMIKNFNKEKDGKLSLSKYEDTVMDVPQPEFTSQQVTYNNNVGQGAQLAVNRSLSNEVRNELMSLNSKIQYDLRNNFVDVNDYCAFYSSLENILSELINYINE